MKAIVQMEITIPEGYELAEPMMRQVNIGELFIDGYGNVEECRCVLHKKYPILKKKWEPEKGKYYMFSNYVDRVSTGEGYMSKFNYMCETQYATYDGDRWNYCWTIPKNMIGE